MEKYEIYEQALEWGKNNYPDAPTSSHQAFASVVKFACTGQNRRAVIKTIRTLVAMDVILHNHSSPVEFEQAVNLLSEACYGKITIEHAQKYKHDRPEGEEAADIRDAQRFIEQFPDILTSNISRDQ
jgi:hypothetical protein